MHGYGELGLYHFRRFGGFFCGHNIGSAYGEEGDVWFETLHFRNCVGVAGVVDSQTFHSDDVAGLSVLFGMEDLSGFSELVQIVGRDNFDRDIAEFQFVSWFCHSDFFDFEA